MERFARKFNPYIASTGLSTSFTQYYLRCATPVGSGYCQQQFLRVDGNPQNQQRECAVKIVH